MGNPVSPILANLVMNELISDVLGRIPLDIHLKSYIHDLILAKIPKYQYFNNYDKNIPFSCERKEKYNLDFENIRTFSGLQIL